MKRIGLFLLTNFLIIITLSIVMQLFGLDRQFLTEYGIDYEKLFIICLVWGMGGAFISLQLSRFSAKMMMGVKVIDPDKPGEYGWLVNMVSKLSKSAGLPKLPEIGVYQSADVNAFATGPSKSRSLVAFSSGLLSSMSQDEIEGVAAHEIAHIQNGDMVTMTLVQGVVNAFVMFLARVIAFAISNASRSENSRAHTNYLVVFLLEMVLGILGMIVVTWFSRQREFRADAGASQYAGREKMLAALQKLSRTSSGRIHEEEPASIAAFKISGQSKGFLSLFATHPPLSERIARLQQGR